MSQRRCGESISKDDISVIALIYGECREKDDCCIHKYEENKKYIEEAFAEADEYENEYGEEFECEYDDREEYSII